MFVVIIIMSKKAQRVAGMVGVMNKDIVWKHMRHSLVRSPDRSVIPVRSCRVHCAMEPVAAAAGGAVLVVKLGILWEVLRVGR